MVESAILTPIIKKTPPVTIAAYYYIQFEPIKLK